MTALRTDLQGSALLDDPTFNKGTAFSREERKAFGINAYLPYQVHTLEEQKKRAWQQYSSRSDDLARNTFLTSLRDQNTVLYFALLQDHIREVMPVIYTPTEGEAIANYSRLFRRPEGLFLSFPNRDTMEEDVLRYVHEEGRTNEEVDLIVVSDGEQILGIGDQGVGGSAGITTAKAAVYTLCAGIDPARTIAVGLDVGTNNQKLLGDELYVGWRNKRVRGEDYDAFVGKFADLVKKHFPNALLHFEDFGLTNALRLLEKYRPEQSVFNDDIQGTAAISLAAILAACKATGTKLTEQGFVIHGAGTAGFGIAGQIKSAIRHLEGSMNDKEASELFWLVDKDGLLHEGLPSSSIRDAAKAYVRASSEIEAWDVPSSQDSGNEAKKIGLADVVRHAKPTVLIGVSTQGGAFTEEIVRCMAEHSEHPVILPLSNPTKLCEVDPRDAYKWSNGRALLATGSPFPPAKLDEGSEQYEIAECNNALVYPGLGLGTIVSQASRLTDGMIVAGIEAVAALAPCAVEGKTSAALLPPFVDARPVSNAVAVAVAREAVKEGVAQGEGKKALEERMEDEEALEKYVESRMWKAEYRPLELVGA